MWAGSYWAKSFWSGRYWGPVVEEAARRQQQDGGGGEGRRGEGRGDQRFTEQESPEWFEQLDRWEQRSRAQPEVEVVAPKLEPELRKQEMSLAEVREAAANETNTKKRNAMRALLLILEGL